MLYIIEYAPLNKPFTSKYEGDLLGIFGPSRNEDDYIAAARKSPKDRTAEEQRLVDKGSTMQSVRNADFKARKAERTFG